MRTSIRKITKEQFFRAQENGGRLTEEDKEKIFTESERWGYGIYSCHTYEQDGSFYVRFMIGESCD